MLYKIQKGAFKGHWFQNLGLLCSGFLHISVEENNTKAHQLWSIICFPVMFYMILLSLYEQDWVLKIQCEVAHNQHCCNWLIFLKHTLLQKTKANSVFSLVAEEWQRKSSKWYKISDYEWAYQSYFPDAFGKIPTDLLFLRTGCLQVDLHIINIISLITPYSL